MENDLSIHNTILYRLWERTVAPAQSAQAPDNADWNEQTYILSRNGRGVAETLNYLYSTRPSFSIFMEWVQEPGLSEAQGDEHITVDVLSKDDIDFWNTNGYLVIKNVISGDQCAATRAAIWEYIGANPDDPATWYRPHHGKKGMMLDFFQHPALTANRHSAIIRKCYQQLYGDTDIYLLIDKVSYNPPETNDYKFLGSPLHWDVSLQLPIPFVLQGFLYLNDVSETDGAFHCVPGFHHKIDEWINSLPENTDPRQAAPAELKPIAVPGAAGDLVIWHNALPHCATPNKGITPRMVQYIAYKPVTAEKYISWK